MNVIERTQVSDTALPVEQLRDHLRLGSGFSNDGLQDGLLTGFLRASLAAIEARTGKALLSREFDWSIASYSSAPEGEPFPIAPVIQLSGIKLIDDRGAVTDVTSVARLHPDRAHPRLIPVGTNLPVIPAGARLQIVFTAGFGTSFESLPADLAQAVLLLAAHYYEYRDETALSSGCLPFGVTALIERYRPLRLSLGRGSSCALG